MLPTEIITPEMANCDVCQKLFPYADRYAAFVAGATGRICEVMWACGPNCAKKIGAVTPREFHRANPDTDTE